MKQIFFELQSNLNGLYGTPKIKFIFFHILSETGQPGKDMEKIKMSSSDIVFDWAEDVI